MTAATVRAGVPLFPLRTVLYPGGALPLRIFEPRYIDMIRRCLREDDPFGVVPILHGQEVGATPRFHPHGTLARIEHWDQGADGLLHLVTRGGERFDVDNHVVHADGLVVADITLRAEPGDIPSDDNAGALLAQLYAARPEFAPAPPWHLARASWVAYRWAELLALPVSDRLALLTLDAGAAMLARIEPHLPRPPAPDAHEPRH
ncbi:MAG: LON peptidase substrate-binding domain-containing protein [Gammaproteobacteria bacterium]